jgi:hypothetical protein
MGRRTLPTLLAFVLVVCLVAGCGSKGGTTKTTTSATTQAAGRTQVATWFLASGRLDRVTASVANTSAIATAALDALLAGPSGGDTTAIPTGTRLVSLAIANGAATATFSSELATPSRAAQAQIVRTLTQFPTVTQVTIAVDGSGPVPLENGDGTTLAGSATADDYADLLPDAFVVIALPTPGTQVSSPVTLSGTAVVNEGTLGLEVIQDGKVVDTKLVTASAGAPERGDWSTTVSLPAGNVTVTVFEPSAENGTKLHSASVDLDVG